LLLKKVNQLIRDKGYKISNIDSTVVLQKPKISSYIEEVKINISKILEIPHDKVSVKATSTEKLGFEGREEGVSAYAIVLLK